MIRIWKRMLWALLKHATILNYGLVTHTALIAPGCDTHSPFSAYDLLSPGDEVFTDSASLKSMTLFSGITQRPSICLKLSFHAHSPAFSWLQGIAPSLSHSAPAICHARHKLTSLPASTYLWKDLERALVTLLPVVTKHLTEAARGRKMCCGSQSAAESVMAESWHKLGGSWLHCVYLGGQLVTLCL